MKLPGLDIDICPFGEAKAGDYIIPIITYEEARLTVTYNSVPDSELKVMFISKPLQILNNGNYGCFVTVKLRNSKIPLWWISPNHCVIVRKKDATPEKLKEVMCYLMLKK